MEEGNEDRIQNDIKVEMEAGAAEGKGGKEWGRKVKRSRRRRNDIVVEMVARAAEGKGGRRGRRRKKGMKENKE